MTLRIITFIFILFPLLLSAQSPEQKGLASIVPSEAERYITILASDSLEGRKGGTLGGMKAAEYIKAELKEMGVKSWGKDYFQPFTSDSYRATKDEMRNVLGYIKGKKSDEIVIVGAHYDHIGKRNTPINNDSIFNGADDNASGVAAVLQVARAFVTSGEKPQRTIVFAFWDGEEMGLLGSYHFVEDYYNNITPPLMVAPEIKAYINCDMVGRDKDGDKKHVVAYYSPEMEVFETWINDDIDNFNLYLEPEFKIMDNLSGGSDHMPFLEKRVPIVFYHTDLHKDYHKLTDHADKINFDKVSEIAKLTFLNLWHMVNEEY